MGPHSLRLDALRKLSNNFIFQRLREDHYHQSPLYHFLTVLAIDVNSGGLRSAPQFLPLLAGTLYDIRILAVGELASLQAEAVSGKSIDDILKSRQAEYVCEETGTPTRKLLTLMGYTLTLYVMPKPKYARWLGADHKMMSLNRQNVALETFRDMNTITLSQLKIYFGSL